MSQYSKQKYQVHYNTVRDKSFQQNNDDLDYDQVPQSSQSVRSKIVAKSNSHQSNQLQIKELSRQQSPKNIQSGCTSPKENQNQVKDRFLEYKNEEDKIVCKRFPHLKFCSCKYPDSSLDDSQNIIQIFDNIFIGDFKAGYSTQTLLKNQITHILNLQTGEYTPRKYFKYLKVQVFESNDEDIKIHFRITNRFIDEALNQGGKVLLHDKNSKSLTPAFLIAYMINNKKISFKQSLNMLKECIPDLDINLDLISQLEQYDLEKLANHRPQ